MSGDNNGAREHIMDAITQQTLIANWTPHLGVPQFTIGQTIAVATNELSRRVDHVAVSAIGAHYRGMWTYEVTVCGHRSRLYRDERGWRLEAGGSSQPADVLA